MAIFDHVEYIKLLVEFKAIPVNGSGIGANIIIIIYLWPFPKTFDTAL